MGSLGRCGWVWSSLLTVYHRWWCVACRFVNGAAPMHLIGIITFNRFEFGIFVLRRTSTFCQYRRLDYFNGCYVTSISWKLQSCAYRSYFLRYGRDYARLNNTAGNSQKLYRGTLNWICDNPLKSSIDWNSLAVLHWHFCRSYIVTFITATLRSVSLWTR